MHLSKLLASLGLDKCRAWQVFLIEMSVWCNTACIPMQLGQWHLSTGNMQHMTCLHGEVGKRPPAARITDPPYLGTFTKNQANVLPSTRRCTQLALFEAVTC